MYPRIWSKAIFPLPQETASAETKGTPVSYKTGVVCGPSVIAIDMSPPTKELMKLVLEQKIAHGGHPVLRWMMDNIFIRTDPAGNIKPDKEKSTEKIDGAVATIMALDRAIRCGNDKTESVYDNRGILFI